MGANNADRLRPWLTDHPQGTIGDVYDAWLSQMSLRAVCRVLERMIAAGELTVSGRGYVYRFQAVRPAGKQQRVWTVLRSLSQARPAMRASAVALLAECSFDYATKYLRWLAREGYLVRRPRGYALAREAPLEAPHWHRRREEKKQ